MTGEAKVSFVNKQNKKNDRIVYRSDEIIFNQVGLQFLPKRGLLRISLRQARIWNLLEDSLAKESVSNIKNIAKGTTDPIQVKRNPCNNFEKSM